MVHDFDILIIGSGIVGLTLANLLADMPLQIGVLEMNSPTSFTPQIPYDIRVSAITRGSENIWRQLHIWEEIQNTRVSPFRKMHVWDEQGSGMLDFDAADIGEPHLGNIVENNLIIHALKQKIAQHTHIKIIYDCKLKKLTINNDKISVFTEDNEQFTARLMVGSDGGKSWLREQAKIPVEYKNYLHSALITTIETEKSHQETAWQRFLNEGVLAFLPLKSSNQCSIVWSMKPELANKLLECSEESFNDKLAKTFDFKLGKTSICDQRFVLPLQMQHAKDYVRARIALIGDAAHTLHPLAGQGLNLGIADADALANVIKQALQENRDIGSLQILQRYQLARKADNQLMIALVSSLKSFFGTPTVPIVWVRNCGLKLTNQFSPLKNFLMRRAMGI